MATLFNTSTRRFFARDSFFSTGGLILTYDKAEHALTAYWLTLPAYIAAPALLADYGVPMVMALGLAPWLLVNLAAQALGVLWETKDALLDYRDWGKIGGDGFSWRDLVANNYGIWGALATVAVGVPGAIMVGVAWHAALGLYLLEAQRRNQV